MPELNVDEVVQIVELAPGVDLHMWDDGHGSVQVYGPNGYCDGESMSIDELENLVKDLRTWIELRKAKKMGKIPPTIPPTIPPAIE